MPKPSSREPREDHFVQSLERGLSVIRALGARDPQTLTEVAGATGLTRATARRFLLTLADLGYVRARDGRFALTPHVLELGYAYLSSSTLPEVSQPHLERLVEEVHESSSVSLLDGTDIVYVARVPTRRIMAVSISVGTRFPAYATSMGRVLLAGLSEPELTARLEDTAFESLTDVTVTDESELREKLQEVRQRGFAIVDQELEIGLRSVAVPIRRPGGEVAAAMNVTAHASRTSLAQMRRQLLPPLKATADAIGRDLAATGVR